MSKFAPVQVNDLTVLPVHAIKCIYSDLEGTVSIDYQLTDKSLLLTVTSSYSIFDLVRAWENAVKK